MYIFGGTLAARASTCAFYSHPPLEMRARGHRPGATQPQGFPEQLGPSLQASMRSRPERGTHLQMVCGPLLNLSALRHAEMMEPLPAAIENQSRQFFDIERRKLDNFCVVLWHLNYESETWVLYT